jgi:hypothetical protein
MLCPQGRAAHHVAGRRRRRRRSRVNRPSPDRRSATRQTRCDARPASCNVAVRHSGETAALGEHRHCAVVSAIEFVSTRPAVVLVNAPSFANPISRFRTRQTTEAIARGPARRRSFLAVVLVFHHARTPAPGRGPREAQGYHRPEPKLAIRRSYAPSARRRGAASCAPCWHDAPSAGPNQVGGV